jgi:Ribbon-helix-helix protein, copG family
MAIVKRPVREWSDSAIPDPMAFIEGAGQPEAGEPRRKRKEPVIIRFDDDTLKRVDQAAAKRGLSRAALVRMLVIENLPD